VNEFLPGANYTGPNCRVVNVLSPEMKACFHKVDFEALGLHVKERSKCDPNRGNMYIDAGFASNLSSRRVKGQDCGVAKPAELKPHPSGKDIFAEATLALGRFALLVCPNSMKAKLYQGDERRNREFAGRHVKGNILEVMRVALTNEKFLVGCHADKFNDVLEWNEGVVNYSTWIEIDCEWWRLSLIGYSRKSISDYYRRLDLYGPLVDRISGFMDTLPAERVEISPSLLHFPDSACDVKRMKPHVNKCVFYSSFVECFHLLQVRLDLTKWHLFGMMVNVTSSETPDYMWQVKNDILSSLELQEEAKTLGPIDFGLFLYHKIFDKKEAVSAGKLPVAGQRHQPHNNTRQASHKIAASIRNLIKLHHGLNLLDSRLYSDIHYYCRAIALLEQGWDKNGVYGAGALTAQHIFGVGVLLGIYPAEMLQHALLAEGSNAYKYLAKTFGLDDHIKDTYQLLANGACYLGISWFEMENVLCKWTQFAGGTDKTAVDSIYFGQSIYYMDKEHRLVMVTSDGVSYVLPCSSRCRESLSLDATLGAPSPALDYSFWEQRLYDKKKVFPLKSQTREYLKQFLLTFQAGEQEKVHAPPTKRPIIDDTARLLAERAHASVFPVVGSTAGSQEGRSTTGDTSKRKKSGQLSLKQRKKSRVPSLTSSLVTTQHTSVVVTGSVIVPGVPSQHRLIMEESRQPFHVGDLAREALSISPLAKLKDVIVTTRKPFKDTLNRPVSYVTVALRISPSQQMWRPPSQMTNLLGGLLSSFVEEDIRWFLNKKDASRYTLLCAALVGNKAFTSDVLIPRYYTPDFEGDMVVLYDAVRNQHQGGKLLFAALTRVGKSRVNFHLVDDVGNAYCHLGGLSIDT